METEERLDMPDSPQYQARGGQGGQSANGSGGRHQKNTHEYCQGYVDDNGIWNNGFLCPRWGGPELNYCCAREGGERVCCPEPHSSVPVTPATTTTTTTTTITTTTTFSFDVISTGNSSLLNRLGPISGITGIGLLLFIIIILVCFLCPPCPGYRRRRKLRRTPAVLTRTISVNMEAEATSSVIAAEALVPLTSGSPDTTHSPYRGHGYEACESSQGHCSSPGHSSEDGQLRSCGCSRAWSPSTSQSTMVDIESLVATMYQNTALPWQTDLDNLYNSYEHRPSPRHTGYCSSIGCTSDQDLLKPDPPKHITLSTSGRNISLNQNGRVPSPLCLESFRAKHGGYKPSPTHITPLRQPSFDTLLPSPYTTLERQGAVRDGSVPHRTYGYPQQPPPPVSQTTTAALEGFVLTRRGEGVLGGGVLGAGEGLQDADRQRRDSGVLVEEQDSSNESFSGLNSPPPQPPLTCSSRG